MVGSSGRNIQRNHKLDKLSSYCNTYKKHGANIEIKYSAGGEKI